MPTEAEGVVSVSALGPSGRKADYSNYGTRADGLLRAGRLLPRLLRHAAAPGAGEPHPRSVPVRRRHDRGLRGHQRPGNRSIRSSSPTARAPPPTPAPTGSTCRARRWRHRTRPVWPLWWSAPTAGGITAHGGLTLDPGEVEKVMRKTAIDTPCPNPPLVDYIDEGRDPDLHRILRGPGLEERVLRPRHRERAGRRSLIASPHPVPGERAGALPSARRRQGAQAQLGELRTVDGGRRAGHGVGPRLRLGEGDDLADVLLTGQDGHEAVDAEREPAVGRGAVAERAEEEAEAPVGLLRGDAQEAEDALLQLGLVDPDRA